MGEALELAHKAAQCGEVPVGAIVVRENSIVGQGHNRPIGNHDPTAHAEIEALRDAARSLGNYRIPASTLYVTLEPCPMCVGAMIHARVRRVVFAASDKKTGALGGAYDFFALGHHNHIFDVTAGVRATEASQMISAFFAERRAAGKRARNLSNKGESL